MTNKSLQQRLEEARANSPVNDLTNQQAAIRASNTSRKDDEFFQENTALAAKKRSQTAEWQQSIKNRKIDYDSIDHTNTKKAQSCKCKTPWGEFNSVKEAAIAGNIHEEKLRQKMMRQEPGFWKEDKHNGKKYSKPIQTPFGKFPSKAEAGRFAIKNNIMLNAVKKLEKFLKTDPKNYYYIDQP